MSKLNVHLSGLPQELAQALEAEYTKLARHVALQEWDDAEIDAGRFSEAVLRVLEWGMSGAYTPIDGQQKPNRKSVCGKAANATKLPSSMRIQVPAFAELLLDFRNNRNAAHLGGVDPGSIDGVTVHQMASWILAEFVRIYGAVSQSDTQAMLDRLSMRPVPLVFEVAGTKVVLAQKLPTTDKVLVLLASEGGVAESQQLAEWCDYKNLTRWRTVILKQLASNQLVYIDTKTIHLLPAGSQRANSLVLANA